jgi:small subunit ribosomal protein S20
MAHHKSALKRIKLQEKQRERNRAYKTRMKTAIKRVRELESREGALDVLVQAYSEIDKLAQKGIIPKNRAANKKSSLAKFVNSLS